jgi:hypothetical protein
MTKANEAITPLIKDVCEGDYNSKYFDYNNNGLTKREYFAAMAMQGLLSNPTIITGTQKTISVPALAESSTHYADALINELNK